MKKHSDFSASKSDIWINCPASVKACKGVPTIESVYALEGTAAHALAEVSLKKRISPLKVKLKDIEEENLVPLINDEMREHVKTYYDEVMATAMRGELLVEEKIKLDFIDKEMFGTSDAVIIEPFGDIHVYDLKFGKGYRVEAENNSQAVYYGLGVAHRNDYNFGRLHLGIIQPRINHKSIWSVGQSTLDEWKNKFTHAVKKARGKNPEFKAGSWCKWCPINSTCTTRKNEMESLALVQFDEPKSKPPKVTVLTPEAVSNILEKAPAIEDFLNDIRAYAIRRLEAGHPVPGWKLVDKRGRRVWKNQKQMEKALKNKKDLWTKPELLSPAQAEKIVGKEYVNDNCVVVSSGKTLAREGDSRDTAERDVEVQFGD